MVERPLSMREVPGSIPGFSKLNFFILFVVVSTSDSPSPSLDFVTFSIFFAGQGAKSKLSAFYQT